LCAPFAGIWKKAEVQEFGQALENSPWDKQRNHGCSCGRVGEGVMYSENTADSLVRTIMSQNETLKTFFIRLVVKSLISGDNGGGGCVCVNGG
jgi:hypothetical protein